MNLSELFQLYSKERDYEKFVFGNYKEVDALSLASFLIFLKGYCDKALTAYAGKWDKDLPEWLLTCKEFEQDGSAPVKAYEEIIKIMALAGAALETYAKIDPEKWREDLEVHINKWKE
jgi:hypothetical protein